MKGRTSSVLFGLMVALCLTQIVWWTFFQLREAQRLERVAGLLERGDAAGAAEALGAGKSVRERAHGRFVMFASEGAAMSLAVLAGVVLFYAAMQRERRTRQNYERFLTGATHELKTPLTTLRLGLESMLAGRVSPGRIDGYLRTMSGEVERLERDVHNLLRAAGLRSEHAVLTVSRGDLGLDVRAALAEMASRFDAAGIAVDADVEPELIVRRDTEAITTLTRNLLDNACKYSERGSRVAMTLRRAADGVELRVADRGAGIPVDEQRRIFDPLFRGSRVAHVGGAGLGLYLVRQIAHAHGGSVAVHSAGEQKGSEFVVRLPLAEQAT